MSVLLSAPSPIRCVLVANRGEIAARIIRTCRRLGLRTVAVHSEADRAAPHVAAADQAICLGAGAAASNYLNIAAIIDAAKAGGADAVHPGYGFLSENASFVRACEAAGLRFIGPSADAIEKMGSKIEAKRIAVGLGVPTVPGFDGAGATPADFAARADEIGYPVLIKASAGGGGRGMRKVSRREDLAAAFADAAQEAGAAFGDPTLLLEKFVESPRHIEVQLFGDSQGNLVHLFDRDCSVQRNNQKVLEEAPAPNLAPETRARLHDYALKLGRGIGYQSAGTVEFILGADGENPYFLEMNTRLQVEHPVTEEVCDVDLVEWQLRVAAGLPLPLSQDEIRPRGHAIEARLAAEQPGQGFMPSIGTVRHVRPPRSARFDSGIAEGSEIGTFYDSMIGKVIAYGPSREAALSNLRHALEDMAVLGVGTNQRFLVDCIETEAFSAGRATTGFLDSNFPEGWNADPRLLLQARALAALAWSRTGNASPWLRQDGFRVTGHRRPATLSFRTQDEFGNADIIVRIGPDGIVADSGDATVEIAPAPSLDLLFKADDACALVRDGDLVMVSYRGLGLVVKVARMTRAHAASGGAHQSAGSLFAPLPGLITGVLTAEGATVAAGEVVVTMEAMKLVHSLTAPFDGVVVKIHRGEGEVVPAKTLVLEMEES